LAVLDRCDRASDLCAGTGGEHRLYRNHMAALWQY